MNREQHLADLKQRISTLWQHREQLKSAVANALDAPVRCHLWQQLEEVDAQLADLDTQFVTASHRANTTGA